MSTSFTPPSPAELDALLSAYEVHDFIAKGGMGAVYLGRQISLDRPVAIKILPDEFGSDPSYRISFETEAKAMARLNHPYLVGIYDFGDLNGTLYIIMEYVPGRTLFELSHGNVIEMKVAAGLISKMCIGLHHAHMANLIHRDIKPANVLIDEQRNPKIVDFGLARPVDDSHEGIVFGTPGYTAPEIYTNPHIADHRSDIYSVGVMLYELLTGKLPSTPFIPVSSTAGVHPGFDLIIRRSIHPQMDQRYNDAAEMAAAIDTLLANLESKPPAAQVPTPAVLATPSFHSNAVIGSRLTRPVVAKKTSSFAPLLLVGVLVLSIASYFVWSKQQQNQKEITENKSAAELAQEQSKHEKSTAQAKREIAEQERIKFKQRMLEEKRLRDIEKVELLEQAAEEEH